MRIAYLIHWNEGPDSGVFKKVVSQVTEWSRQGHEVGLFLFTAGDPQDWKDAIKGVQLIIQPYSKGMWRNSEFRKLVYRVDQWKPDVVYHRFETHYSRLPELLRKIPSVLEINANDITEMRRRNIFKYTHHTMTREKVLRSTSGFIFVSSEIMDSEHFRRQAKDRIVIGNSIALHDFTPAPPTDNKDPRLIFIGEPRSSWNGIDAIADMARMHKGWHFDIIGISPSEYKKSVPENMKFHGKLSKSQYEPFMQQADVALGSLALYRRGMNEASPLKVREYLAYGLPVINGYVDTDFKEEVPFILRIPNESRNTVKASAEIEKFVKSWQGRRVDRSDVEHLDIAVKETVRLAYMKRIREKGGIR
ncbi:hypothetical protein D3C74_185750 [compost metagenome]